MDTPTPTSVDVTLDLGEAGCGQLVMEIKVAMVVANAAVASGKNTMVFLSSEGVRLGVKGVAENIHEEGFQPMADLIWKS